MLKNATSVSNSDKMFFDKQNPSKAKKKKVLNNKTRTSNMSDSNYNYNQNILVNKKVNEEDIGTVIKEFKGNKNENNNSSSNRSASLKFSSYLNQNKSKPQYRDKIVTTDNQISDFNIVPNSKIKQFIKANRSSEGFYPSDRSGSNYSKVTTTKNPKKVNNISEN